MLFSKYYLQVCRMKQCMMMNLSIYTRVTVYSDEPFHILISILMIMVTIYRYVYHWSTKHNVYVLQLFPLITLIADNDTIYHLCMKLLTGSEIFRMLEYFSSQGNIYEIEIFPFFLLFNTHEKPMYSSSFFCLYFR
jgi:hypothetical protein